MLYRFSVLGARRADPEDKIGGPAVAGWEEKGTRSAGEHPFLYNFIRFAAETGIPELGLDRLPLDFIVWHQFDTDGRGEPLLFEKPVGEIRRWLEEFGYDPATELGISAWNSWWNFGADPDELSPERDSEEVLSRGV